IFNEFDHIVSRTTLKAPRVNDHGMDDRILTNHIIEFLGEQETDEPFFILIMWYNLHQPFLVDKDFRTEFKVGADLESARHWSSLGITDANLKSVVETLEDNYMMNNTVIAFGADHGETVGEHNRLSKPKATILSVPLWFYIPPQILLGTEKLALDYNSKFGTVSNLDVVPTLIDIMKWGNSSVDYFNTNSSISGRSLLSELPLDRWISGWAGPPFVHSCSSRHLYFANQTHIYWYHHQLDIFTQEITEPPNYSLIKDSILLSELNVDSFQQLNVLPQTLTRKCKGFRQVNRNVF
ncbi:alkaline-phosphatase-like protein, partial [Globomyces pollinis-pini]